MKTSSILITLLIVNSGFFAGHLMIQFIGAINPFIIGGLEIVLGAAYYGHTVLRDVRKAFDVDITL